MIAFVAHIKSHTFLGFRDLIFYPGTSSPLHISFSRSNGRCDKIPEVALMPNGDDDLPNHDVMGEHFDPLG